MDTYQKRGREVRFRVKKHEASIFGSVKKARRMIAREDGRLMLILSSFVFLLSCMLYVFVYRTLAILISLLPLLPSTAAWLFGALCTVCFFVLTLFLILPLFVGWMTQACAMARGEEANALLFFSAFSERRKYRLALRYSAGLMLSVIPVVLAVLLTYLGARALFVGRLVGSLLSAVLILLELFVGLLLLLRGFGRLYTLMFDGRMPGRKVQEKVRRLFADDRRAPLRYFAYFFPRILLGLATLGIYLFADVLPVMATTYFCDCDTHAQDAEDDVQDSNLEDINDHE